jgi:hypothetical protein
MFYGVPTSGRNVQNYREQRRIVVHYFSRHRLSKNSVRNGIHRTLNTLVYYNQNFSPLLSEKGLTFAMDGATIINKSFLNPVISE